MCNEAKLNIQGDLMFINLFLLDLTGANMIMDIECFKSVGSVLSDYLNMSEQFQWQGSLVTWIGEPLIFEEPFSCGELKNLVMASTNVYFCRLGRVGESNV